MDGLRALVQGPELICTPTWVVNKIFYCFTGILSLRFHF